MAEDGRWSRRPAGSNWGDFGPDDQIGRMNLITPQRRLEAAAEIRTGNSFMLSLPLDRPRARPGNARRPPRLAAARNEGGMPLYNRPTGIGTAEPRGVVCDDQVTLHTQFSTQWDALAHWGARFDADGDDVDEIVYYNGYRAGEHIAPPDGGHPGASALGIERLAGSGVQGRASVVSLAAAFGTGRTWVDHDALQEALSRQQVEVREGDFLLLHTGFDQAALALEEGGDPATVEKTGAVLDGRDDRLLGWIADSGLVALCSDNRAVEGYGYDDPAGSSMLPLHDLCLFKLGIHLGELWMLYELSAWMLQHRRTACFLTAPPLCLPGATGSPVTPIATV